MKAPPRHRPSARANTKLSISGRPTRPKLYDLSTDIGEANNLDAEHPALVDTLHVLFHQARTPSVHWPMQKEE